MFTFAIRTFGAPAPNDDKVIGNVWGGLLNRNSGVGYASLLVSPSLARVVCLNGMTAPIPDTILLRRAYRGITDERLLDALTKNLRELPGRISHGAQVLAAARNGRIENPEQEFVHVLELPRMPQGLLTNLQTAYALEPEQTTFHKPSRERVRNVRQRTRFELDRAAGTYLLQNVSAN